MPLWHRLSRLPGRWLGFYMGLYLCLLAGLLTLVFSGTAQAGTDAQLPDATPVAGAPRIALDHRYHHFGEVVQGKQVIHQFPFTNVGDAELIINEVSTPCGCTAVLPDKDRLQPGESSYIEVNYDSAARSGEVTRIITLMSNDPVEPELKLEVVATVNASMHEAFAAGETLFGEKCGSCHAVPAAGKQGAALFEVACWFCHGKYREGKTAPALGVYAPAAEPFLRDMIENGRPGTEMPGFSVSHNGPLDAEQVNSLIELLFQEPPAEPESEEKKVPEVRPVGDPNMPFFQ